ncbi:hypothetical protein EMIT07CA2_140083 [Brevibacillus sp. IT-7CA2]
MEVADADGDDDDGQFAKIMDGG